MLLFLITGISLLFLFFIKSICPKPFPPWASDLRSLPLCFFKKLSSFSPSSAVKIKRSPLGAKFSKEHTVSSKKVESIQASVLDLPEQLVDCILERLPPADLCSLASVCRSFRERCSSEHLWESHLKQKWGRILGPAAYAEWQCLVAAATNFQGLLKFVRQVWPFSQLDHTNNTRLPIDSAMSWYLALETGKFCLPAQVYNRENVHAGFMLSCYDAQLTYDFQSDTFEARYPSHGRKALAIVETGIKWERVRAPPLDTCPPHQLHDSDCLNDLRPGNHIEIQWRRNKGFPYGWWYCVVGHLESCDRNEKHCLCHSSDSVVLEFRQYTPGSRWRYATINRKEHREELNGADGFYGGIRKLHNHDEIATWKGFWPKHSLE